MFQYLRWETELPLCLCTAADRHSSDTQVKEKENPTECLYLGRCLYPLFENRVLRGIFGPKGDKVTGEWRKLQSGELHNLYS
jgi:hypothetical protein